MTDIDPPESEELINPGAAMADSDEVYDVGDGPIAAIYRLPADYSAHVVDVEALRAVIVRANNALFSVGPDIQDAEHMIECHADTATEAYRRLAVGANEAWGVLTAAVADMVEPKA